MASGSSGPGAFLLSLQGVRKARGAQKLAKNPSGNYYFTFQKNGTTRRVREKRLRKRLNMATMTKEIAAKTISEHGKNAKDSGNAKVQVALLTHRIAEI